MDLIRFKDECVVTRVQSENEWNEPDTELVHMGACLYQPASPSYIDGMTQAYDVIFIKNPSRQIRPNDDVVVSLDSGRVFSASIQSVRDMTFERINQKIARIELKNSVEKQ